MFINLLFLYFWILSFGGGGIGAEANPIFGKSGGIIAVDVVRGGHGYAYLPQVSARDDCDYGSGAVFMVELGETVDEWQYFDLASDYEEIGRASCRERV